MNKTLLVLTCPVCARPKISETIVKTNWVLSCGQHSWLNEGDSGIDLNAALGPSVPFETEYRPLADTAEYLKKVN